MSLGRRKARLDDPAAWVFNRMAASYGARPPYPAVLLDAVAALAGDTGARIADLGAGIGHLALPLAARGYDVSAVEPAEAMLAVLRESAHAAGLRVRAVHAAVEALPLAAASVDLALVADALHFMDAERAGSEIGRVLRPGGALVLVTCTFADRPFMRALARIMADAAPRRPRDVERMRAQLAAVAGVALGPVHEHVDEVAVTAATLERILQSISYIGPAMNAARLEAFRRRVHALAEAPVWARQVRWWSGRRGG